MRCLTEAFLSSDSRPPVSGSGLSEDERFSYGYSSLCGKRMSMEDFYDARISKIDDTVVGLFGVFDGHGGSEAAEYVKKNLFDNLTRHPHFVSNTKLAIGQWIFVQTLDWLIEQSSSLFFSFFPEEAYRKTDADYLHNGPDQCGSTASTAILVGDRLLVANLGDSRAVLCKAGEAVPLSNDHKPDRSDERQRIENAGGYVLYLGTWRVGGVLAVSRAFGDSSLKKFVLADPEIQEERITEDVEFLLLASDGLWDVLTNQDAVSMVQSILDPEEAAKRLTSEAYGKGSADNITCVVVRFLHKNSKCE
ncbi:probable protein phosphatase 2C 45 isoform X1 [Selaginella moellendorffii]|uniref:probable protein phosphatase 2C 45 isoform X1 n=1 Tax=Selaginella moellendorffii TaxID=88036 RepID=UPI000D1C6CC0|nr:probable protein phosphatase 2C 45 isoform X1 [Selaginella moellendorffii]|eukprot:XP_024540912.1 probable protein phosphatase 2C 45 isoform X1 [Selaginella moellendorffii]